MFSDNAQIEIPNYLLHETNVHIFAYRRIELNIFFGFVESHMTHSYVRYLRINDCHIDPDNPLILIWISDTSYICIFNIINGRSCAHKEQRVSENRCELLNPFSENFEIIKLVCMREELRAKIIIKFKFLHDK